MSAIDIIVPLVLILGTVMGWKQGFVSTVCSFVGFFAGLVIAYLLYSVVGAWLAPSLGGNFSMANLIAFGLIWLAVPLALNLVGGMATHILDAIPVIGTLNAMAGALLGLVKYFLLTCCVVNVLIFSGLMGPEIVEASFCASFMKAFFESFVAAYQETRQA